MTYDNMTRDKNNLIGNPYCVKMNKARKRVFTLNQSLSGVKQGSQLSRLLQHQVQLVGSCLEG